MQPTHVFALWAGLEVYYCLKPVLSKKYNVSYKDIFSSYIKKTNNLM